MIDIWSSCDGESHMGVLRAGAIRAVESQEQIATTVLVDTPAKQFILEKLLEESNPPTGDVAHGWHYLITTPFRYLPLHCGSRFGKPTRPGIFYASSARSTLLAEVAYYRLVFWHGMELPPTRQPVITGHTLFAVTVETNKAIQLERAPFNEYRTVISDPVGYDASQRLGEAMRDADVDAFSYISARDPGAGINIGVYKATAIKSRRPGSMQQWACTTRADSVSFIKMHSRTERYAFSIDQFSIGVFPEPACS